MFVFKAAVVGAGTMGGEIAQVVASAGIPVVLKDVKQEFVDVGLTKARDVTEAQLGALVAKGKFSEEDSKRQLEEIAGRITGAVDYGAFGDVDFVVEAVPERMDIKQAVSGWTRSLRGTHPLLQHLVALDHGDERGHHTAGQGLWLSLLLSRLDDAPHRGDRR